MTQSRPCVITSYTGTGPMLALDLATAPRDLLVRIAHAALAAAAKWGDGDVTAQTTDAEKIFERLTAACDCLEPLHKPVVPSLEDLALCGVGGAIAHDAYPVIRDGVIKLVNPPELTPMEREALAQWLAVRATMAASTAGEFSRWLEQCNGDAA